MTRTSPSTGSGNAQGPFEVVPVDGGSPGFFNRCHRVPSGGTVCVTKAVQTTANVSMSPTHLDLVPMPTTPDWSTYSHGTVSFPVINAGSISHEMVILPVPENQVPGTRPVGPDGTIDESGSVGEASGTCTEGCGGGSCRGPRAG